MIKETPSPRTPDDREPAGSYTVLGINHGGDTASTWVTKPEVHAEVTA